MRDDRQNLIDAAGTLAKLYDRPFGGKPRGRFRIAVKHLRHLTKCRRLFEDDVLFLTRELLDRGYILIDMESFFVMMSANSFVNYRRANEECLK